MTDMLTAKEVQSILQVDRSTVYRMAEDGRLPAIKVGRQWRFPVDQMESWLAGQAIAPPVAAMSARRAAPLRTLLPLACVQLIQDTFATALDVMVIITDMDGNPVTTFSNECGLFQAVRGASPLLWPKCMTHWREMAGTLNLEPCLSASYLGLLCARALVRVDAALAGMVFIGGIAPRDWPPSPEQIEAIAADLEIAPSLFRAHLADVFYKDEAQQKKLLSLTQQMANIVSHIIKERAMPVS
ncbi:MAG: PocR ligand-binding domain-containing protein [Anaerolineales bacterium]|nr:PocR ligand-binding domain-containing protein [Anaerolineales bacterium]MCB8953368.1 PocR ligand-binding domain-containing protein [Ardenticatenales bacterium]